MNGLGNRTPKISTGMTKLITFLKTNWKIIVPILLALVGLIIYIVFFRKCNKGLKCFKVEGSLEINKKGIRNDPKAKQVWEGIVSGGSNKETYIPGDKAAGFAVLYPYLRFNITYTNPPNKNALTDLDGWGFDITSIPSNEDVELISQDTYDDLYKFAKYTVTRPDQNSDNGQLGIQKMLPDGTSLYNVTPQDAINKLVEVPDDKKASLATPANSFTAGESNILKFSAGIPVGYDLFEKGSDGICVYYRYKETSIPDYNLFGASKILIPTDKLKYIDISSGDITEIDLEVSFSESVNGGFALTSSESQVFNSGSRTKIIFADMNHKAEVGFDKIIIKGGGNSLTTTPVHEALTDPAADFYVEYLPITSIPFVKGKESSNLSSLGFVYTTTIDDTVGGNVLLLRHADSANGSGGYVGYNSETSDAEIVDSIDKALMFVFAKSKNFVDALYGGDIKSRGKYILVPEPIYYDGTDVDLAQWDDAAGFDATKTRFFFTLKQPEENKKLGYTRVSTRKDIFKVSSVQPPADYDDDFKSSYISFTFTQPLNKGIVLGDNLIRENVFLRLKGGTNNAVPFGIAKGATEGDSNVYVYRTDALQYLTESGITDEQRRFTVTKQKDKPYYSFKSIVNSTIQYLNMDNTGNNSKLIFSSNEEFFYLTSSIYDDNNLKPSVTSESPGFMICSSTITNKEVACIYYKTNAKKVDMKSGTQKVDTIWPKTDITFRTASGNSKGIKLSNYLQPPTEWKASQERWTPANFIFEISDNESSVTQHDKNSEYFTIQYTEIEKHGHVAGRSLNPTTNNFTPSYRYGAALRKDKDIDECKQLCSDASECSGFSFRNRECRFTHGDTGNYTVNNNYTYYDKD